MDTLRFCCAIPQRFALGQLFEVQGSASKTGSDKQEGKRKEQQEYILRSVVCFLGAHYMTYIKQVSVTHNKDGTVDYYPVWRLYDDYKPISSYSCWKDILEKILEYGTLPTVLLYEKVKEANHQNDIYDKMHPDELYSLYKRA